MFQNYRMRNSPRRYFEEMLRMFDVFEVKNGAMTSHHNRLVEDLMAVVREKRGAVSLVAGSDAHTLGRRPRLHLAEAKTVAEFWKVRMGPVSSGAADGILTPLSVYRMVFGTGSVLTENPEFTGARRRHRIAPAPFFKPRGPAGRDTLELPEADS
jgi:hypothetical protein